MTRVVSVIVCAYTLDRWDQLVAALRSVADQKPPPSELILVVDHNRELLARARSELTGVRVVENAGDRGLSGGRNTGLEAATGEVAAFLDDDADAEPGWLEALVAPYEDSRVVGTGGLAIPNWETPRPAWMPEEFDWVVGCSYRGLPEVTAVVRNPIGCNMSFDREAALSVGGFSTAVGRVGSLPTGCDETELSIRLRRLRPDSVIVHVPTARVRHRVPTTRATWAYFRSRCFHEGRSKALLSRLEGSRAGLESERSHVMRVLPAGVLRGLSRAIHGERAGAMRSTAIVAGLMITGSGYLTGRLSPKPVSPGPTPAVDLPADRADDPRRPVVPPVRPIEIELGEPWPAIDGEGSSAGDGGIQLLVRLHGSPVGLLVMPGPSGRPGGSDLEALVQPVVAEAVAAHVLANGCGPAPSAGGSRPSAKSPKVAKGAGRTKGANGPRPACLARGDRLTLDGPPLTVVIPTRDRPDRLAGCIDSLLATGYRHLRVIVVDNAPSGPETEQLVQGRPAWRSRVQYVRVDRAGCAHARNVGRRHATSELVAFLDDDVILDRGWAVGLVSAFSNDSRVGCVTGPIVAAELETQAQIWIEEYGGFCKGFVPRVFDCSEPPPNAPLFPYTAGTFGSGANMAFRRSALRAIGAFDEALGGGTSARGGEDLAAFFCVLQRGWRLVYQPTMLVRHYHHRDYQALRRVLFGYGLGLGAYLTKTVYDHPARLLDVARRIPHGLVYLLNSDAPKNRNKSSSYPFELTARELFGLGLGPYAYLLSRASQRRLAERPTRAEAAENR